MTPETRAKFDKVLKRMSEQDLLEVNVMAIKYIANHRNVARALQSIKYQEGEEIDIFLEKEGWKPAEVVSVNRKTLTVELRDGTSRKGRVTYGRQIRKRGTG